MSYAERAHQHGFPALVVLGGDKAVGAPRCVEHAWELRQMLRARDQGLALGGWANPHADPDRQIDYLTAGNFNAEFYLTQVVSHHHADRVARFLEAGERRGLTLPGLFGVSLSQREPAHAQHPQELSAGARGRARAGFRVRRDA